MTVYVDDMRAKFRRMVMCHMIADTEEDLHAMADRIGVARRWHQGDHYDICVSKRRLAVKFGAHEITWRECGQIVVRRRLAAAARELDGCRAPADFVALRSEVPDPREMPGG